MVHFNLEITDGAFDSCMADRTIMKTLLLLVLSMVAVAREATAQDAECVREHPTMVEKKTAYAVHVTNSISLFVDRESVAAVAGF